MKHQLLYSGGERHHLAVNQPSTSVSDGWLLSRKHKTQNAETLNYIILFIIEDLQLKIFPLKLKDKRDSETQISPHGLIPEQGKYHLFKP